LYHEFQLSHISMIDLTEEPHVVCLYSILDVIIIYFLDRVFGG
jgi:hypothetical protein